MNIETISIKTGAHSELIDITSQVLKVVQKSNVNNGICVVYVPHTTAGVTINENADPSVKKDILKELDKFVPWNDNYSHLEGNAAAHIKASIMGSSVTVIIHSGKLFLGTWQGIFFSEFDGPRNRKIYVKIIEE